MLPSVRLNHLLSSALLTLPLALTPAPLARACTRAV